MRVLYDRKNDIVSVYFGLDDAKSINEAGSSGREELQSENYSMDEAANLLIDMIDLLDGRGNLKGFRVFNASKYYDSELLSSADEEELAPQEISRRPSEKVLGVFTKEGKA